ncbi:MAG: MBOAT family protein [Rhodospirillales bacterium]|nr:MBOAT family protein [Rhodospirillales bacterium]MCB9995990.1 MBOAT family protein [Rhodospirillales bacterium]
MLFHSAAFLFFFLPATLAMFLLLKRFGYGRASMAFIGLASLFFYGWWDPRYLLLLLGSIAFNFMIGQRLTRKGAHKPLLILGIAGNLACLGWFKYCNFFIETANVFLPGDIGLQSIILPLGISFFTFQQIAYLVDAHKGEADEHDFIEYLVFVTFFPQLIAGPIVHHKHMMPQFHDHPVRDYDWTRAAMGLTLFTIGLFKKVVLADEYASYGTPVFAAVQGGAEMSFLEAWGGGLAYTLQLYFDFSGYSDMAIGLGLMFGIRLPMNFNSPYKARSIIEFWQRWHITLTKFLRDYLYIPLGGNRKGETRRHINIVITMLLGGLWHGAGWTFVIWGGLHGLFIVINHIWHTTLPNFFKGVIGTAVSWSITMLAFIVSLTIFRAESLVPAGEMVAGMMGLNGYAGPREGERIGSLLSADIFPLALLGFFIVLALPNSMQMIEAAEGKSEAKWYSWALNKKWLGFTIITLTVTLYFIIYKMNRVNEFIYFQF